MGVIKTIGKVTGTLFLIGILSGSMCAGLFFHSIKTEIYDTSKSDINLNEMPVNLSSRIWYYDTDSEKYIEWVKLNSKENRDWIEYSKIPKDFEHAFVAIEDERFYEHQGVDWKRTIAAAANMFTGGSTFGGSTITQQLIKNITDDDQVTINRKITEICRALKLEKKYTKSNIMEWYMNIIYFGHGQYGIAAASKYYFGKNPNELSVAEMCSIAGITNNPSKYDPYRFPENNNKRKDLILSKMRELGYLSDSEYYANKAIKITFQDHYLDNPSSSEIYPYYVDAVIEDVISYFREEFNVSESQATTMLYYGGYDIYSCVDMNIQKKMDAIYQDSSNIPKTNDGKKLQSSMVVLDPYTGNIVGMEGGVGEKKVVRGLNWATSSLGRRAPGSSIKPIAVYGPALDQKLITPEDSFLDAEGIHLKGTSWMPQNDNHKHYGYVTIRKAVMRSLNTIAAQVIDLVTPEYSYQFLTQKLHMNLEPSDMDYAPLSMGQLSLGTTTREMASAYSIFPTNGTYRQGRTFSVIKNHEGKTIAQNEPLTNEAIRPEAAYEMTQILEDAVTYGTGSGAKLSKMPCAGKTGTTSDNKDRWFVGYTPYYVGAVWTGYETPAPIHIGSNPASTIWKKVMTSIHDGLEIKEFEKPDPAEKEEKAPEKISDKKEESKTESKRLPCYIQGVLTNPDGTLATLYHEKAGNQKEGKWTTLQAKVLNGYELEGESTQSFRVSSDGDNTAIFHYKTIDLTEPFTPTSNPEIDSDMDREAETSDLPEEQASDEIGDVDTEEPYEYQNMFSDVDFWGE